MKRGMSGTFVTTSTTGESVRAFVPHKLPPNPPIQVFQNHQRLLELATLALGRLDSVSLLLPDPNIFLYAYIRREAVLSSQIEGTQSTLADLLLFEINEAPGAPIDDVEEVSGYVAAMEHGMRRLRDGFPLCNRLFREMHEVLLSRGRGSEKSPGEFRKTQNWIGGTRPGNAHYVPPPPDHLDLCMSDLERFIHEPNPSYPILVKAALIHVQFETIHPFLDGNGRIGRLLITFLLHHGQILSRPLLYISLYFKQHRTEYYRLLDLVRSDGDWEAWLGFFLEGVYETATNAVVTAQQLIELMKQDSSKVQNLGRASFSTLRVFYALCQRPISSVKELSNQTQLSFPATMKGINQLVKLQIVKEITGNRRNRIFAYESYLKLLNDTP